MSYQTWKPIYPSIAKTGFVAKTQTLARSELLPAALCSAAILFLCATPGHAEGRVEGRKALDGLRGVLEPKGVSIEADYVGEWVSDHSGAAEGKSFYLDTANIVVKVDLEKALGWKGTSAHMHVLSTGGQHPSEKIGTLEGVTNIESSDSRWRVFEFSVTQKFGANASLEAGYIDLNKHFYETESSLLLLNPAFGIGTELAETGSNGPSIFPSTAPAVVLALAPSKSSYVRLGVFGANANSWGDPEPLKNFKDGVLTIGEVGLTKHGLIALGGWRYSDEVVVHSDHGGADKSYNPWGIYGLIEQPFIESETGRSVIGFLRAGYSDGKTSEMSGSITAGFLVERAISGRPHSQFSVGLRRAYFSDKFKEHAHALHEEALDHESGLEFILADQLGSALTLEGGIQYAPEPGGLRGSQDALISNVRLTVAF